MGIHWEEGVRRSFLDPVPCMMKLVLSLLDVRGLANFRKEGITFQIEVILCAKSWKKEMICQLLETSNDSMRKV